MSEEEFDYIYPWLSDEEHVKAVGQLKRQLEGVFRPFHIHGLDVFIPGAIAEAADLADQFSQRVRGKDIPIQHQGRLF